MSRLAVDAGHLGIAKLPLQGGDAARGYVDELREIARDARASNKPKLVQVADALNVALDDLSATIDHLLGRLENRDVSGALAGATPFLRQFGLAAGGAYLAKSALVGDRADERAALAAFYARNLLPEVGALRRTVEEGSDALDDAAPMLMAG